MAIASRVFFPIGRQAGLPIGKNILQKLKKVKG